MRPYKHLRHGSGYCCEWCDGPYNVWKKANKRHMKRKDKRISIKDAQREIEEHYENEIREDEQKVRE